MPYWTYSRRPLLSKKAKGRIQQTKRKKRR
jgi:hypothetical protein